MEIQLGTYIYIHIYVDLANNARLKQHTVEGNQQSEHLSDKHCECLTNKHGNIRE